MQSLRLLNDSKVSLDERIIFAQSLLQTTAASSHASTAPRIVRIHQDVQLFDWVLNTLVKRPTKGADAHHAVRLQPQLWLIAQALLSQGSIPASHSLPSALLPGMVDALQALVTVESSTASDTVLAIGHLLHLLPTVFGPVFSPSPEHIVSLTEASLKGYNAAGGEHPAWVVVTLEAIDLLRPLGAAPNPRKVWDAAVPRLLLPLITAAFSGDNNNYQSDVANGCKDVLDMLVLNQAHIKVLVETCAETTYLSGGDVPGPDHSKTYASYLFTALQSTLASSSSSETTWQAVAQCLPWLLSRLSVAIDQFRKTIELQSSIEAQHAYPGSRDAKGAHGFSQGLPESADFMVFSALVHLLLPQLTVDSGEGKKAKQRYQRRQRLLRACAMLTDMLRVHLIYKPNQDIHGLHKALLTHLADVAVNIGNTVVQAGTSNEERSSLLPAALDVVASVLAVEHRSVQDHLPQLWPLLWADSGCQKVAERVACSLITAFSELRQLDTLLLSLGNGLHHASEAGVSSVAQVVCSVAVLQALAAAIKGLPTGQLPTIVRSLTAWVESISAAADSSSPQGQVMALILADILCCCLANLPVELTTAVAVAESIQELIHTLSGPLTLCLVKAHAKQWKGYQGPLAAQLAVYTACLRVHGLCGALHPEVVPLPGNQVDASAGAATIPDAFSLLYATTTTSIPSFKDLTTALASTSGAQPALRLSVLRLLQHRLLVLADCQLYLQHKSTPDAALEETQGNDVFDNDVHAELQQLCVVLITSVTASSLPLDKDTPSSDVDVLSLASAASVASHCQSLMRDLMPAMQQGCDASAFKELMQHSVDGGHVEVLGHQDFMEYKGLRDHLAGAVATRLHQLIESIGEAAALPSPSKKSKSKDGSAAESSAAAFSAVLKQLERVSKGKPIKMDSWSTDMHSLAETLLSPTGYTSALGGGSERKKKTNKRKSVEGGSSKAMIGGIAATLELVRALAGIDLQYLPGDAARSMSLTLLSSILCCLAGTPPSSSELAHMTIELVTDALGVMCKLSSTSCNDQTMVVLADVDLPVYLKAIWTAAVGLTRTTSMPALTILAKHIDTLVANVTMEALSCDSSRASDWLAKLTKGNMDFPKVVFADGDDVAAAPLWFSGVLAQGCLTAFESVLTVNAFNAGSNADRDAAILKCINQIENTLPAVSSMDFDFAEDTAMPFLKVQLLGSIAAVATHVIRLRCSSSPTIDAVPSTSAVLSRYSADLQGAVAAVKALHREHHTQSVILPLLQYVDACCLLAGHMKPSVSASHVGQLLALVFEMLASVPGPPRSLRPTRSNLPLLARFPATNDTAPDNQGAVRGALLTALQTLFIHSSTQNLGHMLRFIESELVHVAARAGGSHLGLALCEAALMALEVSGKGSLRVMKHHADRLGSALVRYVIGIAGGVPMGDTSPAAAAMSVQPAAAEILSRFMAVAQHEATNSNQEIRNNKAINQQTTAENAMISVTGIASLATCLRALESLAARPTQFPFNRSQVSQMLRCITTTWEYVSASRSVNVHPTGASVSKVDIPSLGILFLNSCGLLSALLRNRQEDLGRCLAFISQAVRGLISFIVTYEAAIKVGLFPPEVFPCGPACALALSGVLEQVAGLQTSAKYCPGILADYLILACSPPSHKWRELVGPAMQGVGAHQHAGEALAGGALSSATAAALRHGACALYGACSIAEVQYLYACLGQRGGGPWRAALAALKVDHDKTYKFTGKI